MSNHPLSLLRRILLFTTLAALFTFTVSAADQDYLAASNHAVDFLVSQMQVDGSYASTDDLAAYYKSPTTLYAAGRVEEANRLVDYIQNRFLQANGDVLTGPGNKSADFAYTEYYHYTNAWIAMGTQRLGRFDVAVPTHKYLLDFYNKRQGGFNTNGPYHPWDKKGTVTDTLSISHGGLMALYFGDMKKAKAAGDLLLDVYDDQDDLASGFYLRIDWKGRLIKEYPPEMAGFYFVSATDPNQAYFFIGYPIAYLGLLHRATGEDRYQEGANNYLNFALSTTGNIRSFFYAHKVAWGAAICAKNTGNPAYAQLARDICDYLVSIQQPNGQFLPELGVFSSLDQTSEIALWLRYVHAELVSSGN
jgi:hypothetical protein